MDPDQCTHLKSMRSPLPLPAFPFLWMLPGFPPPDGRPCQGTLAGGTGPTPLFLPGVECSNIARSRMPLDGLSNSMTIRVLKHQGCSSGDCQTCCSPAFFSLHSGTPATSMTAAAEQQLGFPQQQGEAA